MCDTQNKTKPIPINYKKSTCQNPTLNHLMNIRSMIMFGPNIVILLL